MAERAHFYDVDDVLVNRERVTRWWGAGYGKLFHNPYPELTVDQIREMSIYQYEVNTPVTDVAERVFLWAHARRQVYPEAKAELSDLHDAGVDLYTTSGRSNKSAWVEATMTTFELAGVAHLFADNHFTPRNVRTGVSKAYSVIRAADELNYQEIEIDEDDPRTVLFFAMLFKDEMPQVKINYRVHQSTKLLVPIAEIEQYPNVTVKPAFKLAA